MMSVLDSLISDDFMPHGHCYLWKPGLVYLHAISDSIIFLSYLTIPLVLIYILNKSKFNIPFNSLLVLFSLFILACGTSHFMEIINIWKSEYFISGVIKTFTAMCSLGTVLALVNLTPRIIVFLAKKENKDVNWEYSETGHFVISGQSTIDLCSSVHLFN